MEQKQGMDRMTVIGLVVIVGIVLGYIYMSTPTAEQQAKYKRENDSTEALKMTEVATKPAEIAPTIPGIAPVADTGIFTGLTPQGMAQKGMMLLVEPPIIENDDMKVWLNPQGGMPLKVELKNFKKSGTEDKVSFLNADTKLEYAFNTADNRTATSKEFYFVPGGIKKDSAGRQTVAMRSKLNDSQYIDHRFGLEAAGFKLKFDLNTVGMRDLINPGKDYIEMNWGIDLEKQERLAKPERERTTIYYKYPGEESVEYMSERADEVLTVDPEIEWVSFKQQYFNMTLMADKKFGTKTHLETRTLADSNKVKNLSANLNLPFTHAANETIGMTFLFAPNHYTTLKASGHDLERLVYLGWGLFGWVNRFVVIPVFGLLDDYILSYGIIILLLTLIIKTVLFPLVYKSYLSTAKMRLLKPEVDALKEKNGSDFQKQQQETMGLYRKAGVNPMGGCFPLLLQMPILFAMFQFFPSAFELRGQSFLWAEDLSTYDSVWDFGVLPIINSIYGDHVSLFTLMMTVSSLLFTLMNNTMTGVTGQMKYIGYLMPVLFLGFFNNYAAGLTWYYFLSNTITIVQQWFIRRFVDEKKLHLQILENKKKPVKKSKFQARLEEVQKQQQLKGRKK
ncbi:MAG: membrane protein insertase YidC [Flavobacteriaceae bacterium]|nr:membrane protein insertase YidC [Flavobacteriaceae bacterium]